MIIKFLGTSYLFLGILSLNAQELNQIKNDLIHLSQQIFVKEQEIREQAKQAKKLKNNQELALKDFLGHQSKFLRLIQMLRHVKEIPPMLVCFSRPSIDEFLKGLRLLKFLTPQLIEKEKSIAVPLKKLATIQNEKNLVLNTYDRLEKELSSFFKRQENLLNQKYKIIHTLEKNKELENVITELDKNFEHQAPPVDLTFLIEKLHKINISSSSLKNEGKFLIEPCIGRKLTHESSPFKLTLSTIPGAQVVSPLEATVIYVGFIPSFEQVIVLKSKDYYVILSGLTSVMCKVGETLLRGEPLGRMYLPTLTNENNLQNKKNLLTLELYYQKDKIDPRGHLEN